MKYLIVIFFVCLTFTLNSQSLSHISYGDDNNFEVVSWNLEFFPKNGQYTIDSVALAMASMNADVYALQEINDVVAFQNLDLKLEGYSSFISPDYYSNLKLAYLVKNNLEVVNYLPIYSSSSYNNMFAGRPPLLLQLKVKDTDIYLINVHFKCCGNGQLNTQDEWDEENRRLQAMNQLKTYVDSYLEDKQVIVLGDFNDLLQDDSANNVFGSILSDTDNYLFTDFPILDLPSSLWSFPSWPSHLDHILISNELFDEFNATYQSVQTIDMPFYFSNGFSAYDALISDHLPIGIKLNFDVSDLEKYNKNPQNIQKVKDIRGRVIPKKTNQILLLQNKNGIVEKHFIVK